MSWVKRSITSADRFVSCFGGHLLKTRSSPALSVEQHAGILTRTYSTNNRESSFVFLDGEVKEYGGVLGASTV